MKARVAAMLALVLGGAHVVNAQGCRLGSGPYIGDGIPYCSELSPDEEEGAEVSSPAPSRTEPLIDLNKRWGAIVIDPEAKDGGVGVSTDQPTRALAEAIAMRRCLDTGGGQTCAVQVSYDNQCAVVAWGDHYFTTANAETLDDASRLGLAACARHTDNCRILYGNCT